MKFAEIKDSINEKPIYNGEPCILLDDTREAVEIEDIGKFYTQLREKKQTLIYIKSNGLEKNPDIRDLVRNFVGMGYRFILDMPATTTINPLRNLKNVSFFLRVDVGTDEFGRNDYKHAPSNLTLMKETDGYVFSIKEEQDILDYIGFCLVKMIQRPFCVFEMRKPMLPRFFSELKKFRFRIVVAF